MNWKELEVYIRDGYINGSSTGNKQVREIEYDVLIQGIRAEAWDEGNRAAGMVLTSNPPRLIENPYRKAVQDD